MEGEDRYLETAQVCNLLGIHRSTLWRLVKEGRLRQYEVPWSKHPRYRSSEVRSLQEHPPINEGDLISAWADTAPDAVWLLELEGRVQYANPAALRGLGCDPGSVIGKPLARWVSGESLAVFLDALARGLEGEATRVPALALHAGREQQRAWETSVSPVIRGGTPAGVLLVGREVTERTAASREQARLEAALAAAPAGVLVTDPGGIVCYANPAAAAILGLPPERMAGRRLESFWSAANPAGTADAMHRSALEGPWRGTVLAQRDDGTERWVRVCMAPARQGARITALVAVVEEWQEEQERIQLELKGAQLQGAVRALQAMESALTEPLLSLQGNLRLLQMSLGEAEGVAGEQLAGALAACEQLAGLGDTLWALAGHPERPVGGPAESATGQPGERAASPVRRDLPTEARGRAR